MACQVVVFELTGRRFGLPSSAVERVLRAVAFAPLPDASPMVEGAINLAGAPVAVLDIRARFGLAPKPLDIADKLIVVRTGARRLAVRIDQVTGLLDLDAADIHPARSVAPMSAHIQGVATLPDGLVLIHDADAFLTEAEALQLDRLALEEAAP